MGRVLTDGLCDAACDPMQAAMARCRDLTRCSRVKLTVEPAFNIFCCGTRRRFRKNIQIQAKIDKEKQQAVERLRKDEAFRRCQDELRRLAGKYYF